MGQDPFITAISRHIWDSKYRYRDGNTIHDQSIADSWRRIARALASVETTDTNSWEQRFYSILENFKFLPGGRIQAGAGTNRRVTLFNCFVMGVIEDSMDGIFEALKEGAITMQQGGGVGYDFSTLRPRGTAARGSGTVASGPVSFMRIWDSMCGTLLSTGARRGAMMATLRCDHPDIEEYIDAKRNGRELRHFNLSIQISDAFMDAMHRNADWALVFPADDLGKQNTAGDETVMRHWPGMAKPIPCRVLRRINAKALWDRIMRATYDYAEPGVLFIDRINRMNNLGYREIITATNPCGEIPLPPYGACDLGSISLTSFVERPFTPSAKFNTNDLCATVKLAVRMMDNVFDLSRFPLELQAAEARGSRRIGLGLTGLADTLIMLGLNYGEDNARRFAAKVMETICHMAYRTSVDLAREKGAFPFFVQDKYLNGGFARTLPTDIRKAIAEHGIRNSHLIAIAPTGTISMLANNISSGLEPVFKYTYHRRVLEQDGSYTTYDLTDYALRLWQRLKGADAPLPPAFVDSTLEPHAHLDMQAALQPYVDNAISKTISVPAEYNFSDFQSLYEQAYNKDLKGCTTFRPNPITGEVLAAETESDTAPHCCTLEREAD